MRLTEINRYPVKSCRGEGLRSASVEPWGLVGDRRWMVVDSDGDCVTAREFPRLLLVVPTLVDGGLMLSSPDVDDIFVATPTADHVDVMVHGRTPFAAALASEQAHEWFSAIVGIACRLVFQDDPKLRPTNPAYSAPDDRVSFADSYPLLVTSEESLAVLNEHIANGPLAHEGPLPTRRFRPNLVVAGAPAWAEDGWRRLRVGAAEFRVVKGCDRCVLTTINPDTAAKGKEPIATLARHRKWDGATWFGMNLVPDTPGAVIAVGDAVEVLAAVDAPDGPPR